MTELCDPYVLRQFCRYAVENDMTKYVNRRHGYRILMSAIDYEGDDAFEIEATEFDKLGAFLQLPDTQMTQSGDSRSQVSVYAFTVLINTLRRRLRGPVIPPPAPH